MKLSEFKQQWENITVLKIFEIEVLDKRTGENDCMVFDVSIRGRSFIAEHVALTEKQEKSKFIAFQKWIIDLDFSIDQNLQELFEKCQTAIIDSDFYQLEH